MAAKRPSVGRQLTWGILSIISLFTVLQVYYFSLSARSILNSLSDKSPSKPPLTPTTTTTTNTDDHQKQHLGEDLQQKQHHNQPITTTSTTTINSIGLSPSLKYGFVDKSGMLPLDRWNPDAFDVRQQQISTFISSPNTRKQQTTGYPALPPLTKCQVWVNHPYKIIYLRHPKSASSSVLHIFGDCRNKVRARPSCLAIFNQQLPSPNNNNNGTTTGGELLQQQDMDLAAIWDDYLVFTVVRNPLTRLLSAHTFELGFIRAECEEAKDLLEWDNFCADPFALGLLCMTSPKCCVLPPHFFWHHLIDQGRCMTTDTGLLATDYILRMENLENDARPLLAEIDRRLPSDSKLPKLSSILSVDMKLNEKKTTCTTNDDDSSSGGGGARMMKYPDDREGLFEAPVPRPRYCEQSTYFTGKHQHCAEAVHYLYRDEINLLYGSSGTGGTSQQ